METFKLANLTKPDLKRVVQLTEYGIGNYAWLEVEAIELSEAEHQQIATIRARLLNYQVHLMNEATIWARGTYPLLVLAEQGQIQAWAEVPVRATYSQFCIEGVADGVLGKCTSDMVEEPYLVMVEAKRGLEAQNPIAQVYGQLLVAARQNWETNHQPIQEIFGCYTIADSWTFLRADVGQLDTDQPTLHVAASREFGAKFEALAIVKLLKAIVARSLSISAGCNR